MRILGLDEAGRGCVLGPLVVGAFLYDGDQTVLRAAGADDSKALSHTKRVSVRTGLEALGTGVIQRVEATDIDDGNINTLEEQAFVALVRRFMPDRVYLDAPVHPGGIPRLRARLVAATGVADWVVEPKADATYPVVGAASIFAKVARDAVIAEIEAETLAAGQGPIGSGYPSDPVTRRFLTARLAEGTPLPSFVRTRWGTIENLRQRPLFG